MIRILIVLLWLPFAAHAQVAQPTSQDPVVNKRAVQIAEELRCLVCQNQSIADSHAELAVDLRRQISEQIAQGKTDAEIMRYMVDRYGDFVLYRPPVKVTTLLLWFGPLALLLLGTVLLVRYLRERRVAIGDQPLSEAERRAAQQLLGSGEGERQ